MGVNVGYGENLFYCLRNDGGNDFASFGTIATSGAHTDRFGTGFNFDALAFASPNPATIPPSETSRLSERSRHPAS